VKGFDLEKYLKNPEARAKFDVLNPARSPRVIDVALEPAPTARAKPAQAGVIQTNAHPLAGIFAFGNGDLMRPGPSCWSRSSTRGSVVARRAARAAIKQNKAFCETFAK
jgi:hypothetical protein